MWGPTCDLLWSDPMDEHDIVDEYFSDNLSRGCGQLFGPEAAKGNEQSDLFRCYFFC